MVRVSTLTLSPILMNKGTWTTTPVLNVAGLPPVPAVSPLRPGSVSATSKITGLRGVTEIGLWRAEGRRGGKEGRARWARDQ